MKTIRHDIYQSDEPFVWIPRHRWRDRVLTALIILFAIASFVWLVQPHIPANTLTNMLGSDPALERRLSNPVRRPPTPPGSQSHAKTSAPGGPASQAVPNRSWSNFEGARTSTGVEQPAPWVIRSR
jgi:hypothetical protein